MQSGFNQRNVGLLGALGGPGSMWTIRASASDSVWRAITYGAGIWVAVGDSGAIMTSPNGRTWTSRTSGVATSLRGIIYAGGQFVVAGHTSTILTSPDGITWTPQTSPSAEDWSSVAYGASTYVLVSAGTGTAAAATSADGVSWTAQTANKNGQQAVIFAKGLFVSVGGPATGSSQYSSDGISWSAGTISNPLSGVWRGLAFGNNRFVAISSQRVATSLDGITWTDGTILASNFNDVTFSVGVFVAVSTNIGNYLVATSTDGLTWIPRVAANLNNWSAVAGNEFGLFVAVASSGTGDRVMTSP